VEKCRGTAIDHDLVKPKILVYFLKNICIMEMPFDASGRSPLILIGPSHGHYHVNSPESVASSTSLLQALMRYGHYRMANSAAGSPSQRNVPEHI
jgi:hypothetical protein